MKRVMVILVLVMSFGVAAVPAEAGIFAHKGECGIRVVSYRVQGTPGTSFQYGGKAFTIPAHGAIEIVARKGTTDLRFGGQLLSLEEGVPDDFGIVDVTLEMPREQIAAATAR